jgi:hypothetical protein
MVVFGVGKRLWQLLAAKKNWEGIAAVVGLLDLTDFYRVIHKVVMKNLFGGTD